jgi:hypothetical protein
MLCMRLMPPQLLLRLCRCSSPKVMGCDAAAGMNHGRSNCLAAATAEVALSVHLPAAPTHRNQLRRVHLLLNGASC